MSAASKWHQPPMVRMDLKETRDRDEQFGVGRQERQGQRQQQMHLVVESTTNGSTRKSLKEATSTSKLTTSESKLAAAAAEKTNKSSQVKRAVEGARLQTDGHLEAGDERLTPLVTRANDETTTTTRRPNENENENENESSLNKSNKQPLQHKKIGLLEALLGERGRNWFEHRTVILDIQNGKKQNKAPATLTGTPDRQKRADDKEANFKQAQPQLNQTELNEPEKQQEKKAESEAQIKRTGRDSPTRAERDKYSRLPTFGSVPQRVQSSAGSLRRAGVAEAGVWRPPVPYFVYHGRARHVELRRPHQSTRPAVESGVKCRQKRTTAGELDRNSLASGRLSNLSSSTAATSCSELASPTNSSESSASPIANKPSERSPSGIKQAPVASRKSSLLGLGFSNISNLFPGQPVKTRQRDGAKSASLTNLADKRAFARQQLQFDKFLLAPEATAAAIERRNRSTAQQRPGVTGVPQRASSMMRQRGSLIGQQASSQAAAAASKANYQRAQQQQQARLRPSSVTGNYVGGASGRARPRSPAASYRLGSAGMSPLVDPECPVHGDNLGAPPQRGRSYERARYADHSTRQAAAAGAGYYSSSQPDLLYAPHGELLAAGQPAPMHDDPYNIARSARDYPAYGNLADRTPAHYQKTSPIYSPLSPIDYDTAGLYSAADRANSRTADRYDKYDRRASPPSGAPHPGAYYNGSSRFSLYQPTGDGSGGVRSSLAPTSEQLRRILGYKPDRLARPVHLHPQWAYTRPFIHLQPAGSGFGRSPSPLGPDGDPLDGNAAEVPKFAPFNRLQDNQAIRAVDFHPSGEVYAVGSNSRALRICAYPAEHELRHFEPFEGAGGGGGGGGGPNANEDDHDQGPAHLSRARAPRVLFKFLQLHRGSIYCVAFNPSGQLLATGSNDQTVHIVKYNSITHNPDGEEFRLTMHNGTVRDLCFIDDSSGNGSSLLLSAGGGDNKIYVTDCDTVTPFQSMAGHTQMVMALNHCGGAQFVSGSYDRTIRFWDLRSRSCTSIVSAPPATSTMASSAAGAGLTSGPGGPVCALRVDPSGRLLASGHTDTTCMLYDIRGGKIIQTFRPHDDEIRAISFSPKSYYLLTGGYDGRLVVSDLQGDLTQPLPSVCVAESQDKIVQAKWHPADFTFVSTSADKSATLWSLPGEIRN